MSPARSRRPSAADRSPSCDNAGVEDALRRIEAHIREHELIPPGGEVACLVSGGADSTCLWHALGALGYRVTALHVDHGLRGAESDDGRAFLPRAARRRRS